MVELQPSKLAMRVRFPSPAPLSNANGRVWCHAVAQQSVAQLRQRGEAHVDRKRAARARNGSDVEIRHSILVWPVTKVTERAMPRWVSGMRACAAQTRAAVTPG